MKLALVLAKGHTSWQSDWVWGCPLIVLTLLIHILGLGFISRRTVLICRDSLKRHHPNTAFATAMGITVLLATILHGIEAGIWAVAYYVIGALPNWRLAMLYSLGAMTTYGHQGLYLQHHWLLLGPIEALNGSLLFGLSTAFIFWMIQEVSPAKRVI